MIGLIVFAVGRILRYRAEDPVRNDDGTFGVIVVWIGVALTFVAAWLINKM